MTFRVLLCSVWVVMEGCNSSPSSSLEMTSSASQDSSSLSLLGSTSVNLITTETFMSTTSGYEAERRCPAEMVRVAENLCVDRYECILVDTKTSKPISPYYPPERKLALALSKKWSDLRFKMGDSAAQQVELPILPDWIQTQSFDPKAISKKNEVPQGYMSGLQAKVACANAGKRLCRLDEWKMACRGETKRNYPYGDQYNVNKCNIFREDHPARVLHNDPSIGHSDPRLNQVFVNGKPLLRRTGQTSSCYSQWGSDGIADMVGNLDEWIDDPEGTFVGGFYARARRDGCDAKVETHAVDYFDYSLGVRCCQDLH